jgi:hypothetical protein
MHGLQQLLSPGFQSPHAHSQKPREADFLNIKLIIARQRKR